MDGKMKHWYLIQFKPNSHRLAERNLRQQGFETFLPMQKITHRKISRFVNDLKPLFPGYMFVSVKSDLDNTSNLVKFKAEQQAPRRKSYISQFLFTTPEYSAESRTVGYVSPMTLVSRERGHRAHGRATSH